MEIIKYPRTKHIKGSNIQHGDEDLKQISFNEIKNKYLVIEEKIDGANVAVSFSNQKELLLQSRGHYLTGGYREHHYNLFKQWANIHSEALFKILNTRYIMYGEWMYAKHAIYYDNLPHYFLEFDIYDKETNKFLDTETRHKMLKNSPVVSVPVLGSGFFNCMEDILKYLGKSNYITKDYFKHLEQDAIKLKLDPNQVFKQSDCSMLMEGLYIKVEENGEVLLRAKYVRNTYSQSIQDSNIHWLNRVIIPNRINKEIDDLFKM